MTEEIINVSHLTRDYKQGRGIFDVNLTVNRGEVFGYLGTNGSGKTTTIRHMMGFIKPEKGEVTVNGLNPWKKAPELMKYIGYIPGEIAFPSFATGTDFLKVQAEYLGLKDLTRMNHLIELMNLDPTADLKRMSKGMKQKTGIVAALMAEKDILILDEPTTGLDPLMRDNFIELIREEKAKGHTVFMSSHIFEEIEDVCDRVGILQDGHLKEILNLSEFRNSSFRHLSVTFKTIGDAEQFRERWNDCVINENNVSCTVKPNDMNHFIKTLKGLSVMLIHEEHKGLEQYFIEVYNREETK